MSVRGKVAVELGVIAVLTTVFLLLFPRRSPAVDVALTGGALLVIALTRRYTRDVIWAESPPPVAECRRGRCWQAVLWITVAPCLVFLLVGAVIAYEGGGWPAVAGRVCNWRILAAFGCYVPWALMQQTLVQFYLLGRLLALFPRQLRWVALLLCGICFGLVHLPDFWTALVVVLSGAVWCLLYYRYRLLLPLAFSHAALGTAFYYGIFGHDLALEWRALLP
jgi:membrane protease YdiL (CAAX protease family)